jgi:CRISPR-associated protein Csh2
VNDPLNARQELFFAYDIRMGNPNGDPDENRPRVLPDNTYYVTDVRLKRFIRDFFKSQGKDILVDSVEGRTTNLTGRVGAWLEKQGKKEANGQELVDIILDSFIDARLFGSSLAFKRDSGGREWEPQPKTLTGAVQFNHGEVLHPAQEVEIRGTSIFASDEANTQGTFTEFFGLRYALIGFNGIANEHSARKSRLSKPDYDDMLAAVWHGVRSAGNTRSKAGQVPRFLLSISYKEGHEFQFGNLLEYVKPEGEGDPRNWSSPVDYTLNIGRLRERLQGFMHHIERISYCLHPDIQLAQADRDFLATCHNLDFDGVR